MTSLVGDSEEKNVGFEARWAQVQALALPFISCWETLDKLFQISLNLSFLPMK